MSGLKSAHGACIQEVNRPQPDQGPTRGEGGEEGFEKPPSAQIVGVCGFGAIEHNPQLCVVD